MAYHGLIPLIKRHLYERPMPRLLEVGVDRGVTFITLVNFLARTKPQFEAVGIDVMVQEQVSIMLAHADLTSGQNASLVEQNSLIALPELVASGRNFDVILLDGDHNYATVEQELPRIDSLLALDGILVVDDYNGKWGRRDMFYADRPGYEDNRNVSVPVRGPKEGVGAAVDDWLSTRPEWTMSSPVGGEPVVIRRRRKP